MHAAAQSGAAGQVALGSMKSQFKKADASGATYALIVGPDEWQKGELSLKNLRDPSATQLQVAMQDWATWASHLKSRH